MPPWRPSIYKCTRSRESSAWQSVQRAIGYVHWLLHPCQKNHSWTRHTDRAHREGSHWPRAANLVRLDPGHCWGDVLWWLLHGWTISEMCQLYQLRTAAVRHGYWESGAPWDECLLFLNLIRRYHVSDFHWSWPLRGWVESAWRHSSEVWTWRALIVIDDAKCWGSVQRTAWIIRRCDGEVLGRSTWGRVNIERWARTIASVIRSRSERSESGDVDNSGTRGCR